MAKAKTKKKAAVTTSGDRTIAVNRKAFHDYEILEKVEAGLVLTGTEVKSVRGGRIDLRDAYARPQDGELWLVNAHVSPYDPASVYNHDPRRPRKLLLHRHQIAYLAAEVAQKGLTLVGLRIYIRNHVVKCELGLARGKRQYDKRRSMIDRELDMAARRAVSSYR